MLVDGRRPRVSAGGGGYGTWRGNEPAGLTVAEEHGYATAGELDFAGSHGSAAGVDASSLVPPISPNNVVEFVYPTGTWHYPDGYTGSQRVDLPAGAVRVYDATMIHMSDPFTLHTDNVKFLYFYRPGDEGSLVVGFRVGLTGVEGIPRLNADPQIAGQAVRYDNTGGPGGAHDFSRGAWHQVEVLAIMNTVAGTADGILKVWLDGLLVLDYSNIKFADTGDDLEWSIVNLNPYYGGQDAGLSVPQVQHLRVDHRVTAYSLSRS